jgi:hypothetical protein
MPLQFILKCHKVSLKKDMCKCLMIHQYLILLFFYVVYYVNSDRQDKIRTTHFDITNKDDGPPSHWSRYFLYCSFTPSDSTCTTSGKFNLTAITLVLSFWIQTESLSFTSEAAMSSYTTRGFFFHWQH